MRIASTGVNFFALPVQLKQNKSVNATINNAHKIFNVRAFVFLITIYSEALLKSISPNGILITNPTIAPIKDSARYFTIYSPRIFTSLMPIAFITPISRYSSESVKPIVNLNTTNEIIIKNKLTTKSTAETTISIVYICLNKSLLPDKTTPQS